MGRRRDCGVRERAVELELAIVVDGTRARLGIGRAVEVACESSGTVAVAGSRLAERDRLGLRVDERPVEV